MSSGTISLHEGDNRASLRELIADGVQVHSVVTDPPYGLTSIVKRFGKEGSAPAKRGTDGAFRRQSAGFMNQTWDGSGIERDPEFWKLIFDILLPGGYCFAFSGARTGHWQACAMEQAGFIMHPMHGWVYGSGFPKAHNASKAIDKKLGQVGAIIPAGEPVKRMIPSNDQNKTETWIKDNGRDYQPGEYLPATEEALKWEGWAYGAQSQKPALEPIYLAQKPFAEKTGAENLIVHGLGSVNIDGCRVNCDEDLVIDDGRRVDMERASIHEGYDRPNATMFRTGKPTIRGGPSNQKGRHPSNLILDGSDEVSAMFPDGKARYFHNFPLEGYPLFYHPKANKADRAGGKHPTVKPIALMQYLVRHITPPGGTVLDPFAGSGTTAEACQREGFDCILMEAEPGYNLFLKNRFNLDLSELLTEKLTSTQIMTDDLVELLG